MVVGELALPAPRDERRRLPASAVASQASHKLDLRGASLCTHPEFRFACRLRPKDEMMRREVQRACRG